MIDFWGRHAKKENKRLIEDNASWVNCNKRYFALAQKFFSEQNDSDEFMGRTSSVSAPCIEVTQKYSVPEDNFFAKFLCFFDIFGIIQNKRMHYLEEQKQRLIAENHSLQQMAAEGLENSIVSKTIQYGPQKQMSVVEFQCPYCYYPNSDIFYKLGVFHYTCKNCNKQYSVVNGKNECIAKK